MNHFFRLAPAVLVTGVLLLAGATTGWGQAKDKKEEKKKDDEPKKAATNLPEPVIERIKTCDGLNLWAKWWRGKNGQNSNTVMLVHAYGSDPTKGPWETLAQGLQEAGYSVLFFHLRGHGESAKPKAMEDWGTFCEFTYNKYAGHGFNPKVPANELNKSKFSPAYYPYLVNDIAGARRYLDKKNDDNECNSGRIFVVAEGNIGPLAMMWAASEFTRNGFWSPVQGAFPTNRPAGQDVGGLVFLSWNGSSGTGTSTALNVARRIMSKPQARTTQFDEAEKKEPPVGEQLRDKVSMLFVYGKGDQGSAAEAKSWLGQFGAATAALQKQKRKYTVEINGDKLAGIKLYEVTEDRKDKDDNPIKVSVLQEHLTAFFLTTIENGKTGGTHEKRNVPPSRIDAVDLTQFGLPAPK
jgi:pimeloyl-ACP methyl ester carboxylesterase